MGLRGGVEPGPLRPAAGHRSARGGVHLDGRHRRQVDDDAIVAGGEAGDAVRSAPDGDRQALARREAKRRDDVVGTAARTIIAGRLSMAPFQMWRAAA